jgi:hypothetical protein
MKAAKVASSTSKLASIALPAAARAAAFAEKQVASKLNTTTIPAKPASPKPPAPAQEAPPTPTAPTQEVQAPTQEVQAPTQEAPTEPIQPVTITDPKELNLFQQFVQKVKSGHLTDVVKDSNGDDELTVFQQIKKKMKDGDFSDIVKSLPTIPPFPTAIVMQIVGSLKDIFDQNIGKVSQLATSLVDNELAKYQNKLKLNNEMAQRATGPALDKHMNIYVSQSFT